jgi:hypothetical protein
MCNECPSKHPRKRKRNTRNASADPCVCATEQGEVVSLEEYASRSATFDSQPLFKSVYSKRSEIARTLSRVKKQKVNQKTGELIEVDRYRTCTCSNALGQQVTLNHTSNGTVHGHKFKGLETCSSVWLCPVCSKKIGSYRASEVTRALDELVAMDYKPFLITSTVRHSRDHALEDTLDAVVKGVGYVMTHRRFKTAFKDTLYIRALEVTYSDANGFHPHVHILMFIKKDQCNSGTEQKLKDIYFDLVQDYFTKNDLDASYERGVDVKESFTSAEYLAKFGHESDWRAGQELTLNMYKPNHPFSIATTHPDKFLEYAEVTLGRAQLIVSKNLRKVLPWILRKTDEEVVKEEAEDFVQTVVVTFKRKDWRTLQQLEVLDHILKLAQESRQDAYADLFSFIEHVLNE